MLFLAAVLAMPVGAAAQPARPNIVLMFPDNLGWGEVGAYGSVRGQLTPRLDKLAAEGIRLNNFNVEFSCIVSRAALMTGRYAIRTGATQPRRHHAVGDHDRGSAEVGRLCDGALRQVASRRRPAGGPREPSHQGFDEFYGIPRTSNEAQTTIAQGQTTPGTSFIWEGQGRRADAQRQAVRHGHAAHRRSRIRRSRHRVHGAQRARAHAVLPLLPDDADPLSHAAASGVRRQDRRGRHRRCDGGGGCTTSAACSTPSIGWGSPQHDRPLVHRQRRRAAAAVARIVGAVVRLLQHGDGGRDPHAVHHPLAGPDSRGRVSNEIVHQLDLFPTLAAAVGADIVPEGSRDRRRQPVAVPRRQAGQVQPRQRAALHQPAAPRREVARLEAALHVSCPRPARRRCRR